MDAGKPAGSEARRTILKDLASLVDTDYRNNGRSSVREVGRAFTHLFEYFGEDCLARLINSERVERYKAARRSQGAANATINRELAALKARLSSRGEGGAHRHTP